MPFENTSRSPRDRELAREIAVARDDRRQPREVGVRGVRGEDEDPAVRICSTQSAAPSPNTCSPICANTVTSWLGYGCRRVASTDTPRNSVARIVPMSASVARRVLRLRPAERGHAVGDGLDAGERDRARREALEDQEEAERAAGLAQHLRLLGVERHLADAAEPTEVALRQPERDRARPRRRCSRTSGSRRGARTP